MLVSLFNYDNWLTEQWVSLIHFNIVELFAFGNTKAPSLEYLPIQSKYD